MSVRFDARPREGRRSSVRLCAPVTAMVALVLGLCSAPADAAGTTSTSFLTAYSEAGDPLGDGSSSVWTSAASDEVRVVPPRTHSIDIEALNRSGTEHMDVLFQPPTGRTLTRGVYANTQRGATTSTPGLDITMGDRGCNSESGRFVIMDITPNQSRFRALYEDHCDGGPALFGEISYHEPASPKGVLAASDRIEWPALLPGRHARVVPVQVADTSASPTRFSTVSITKGAPYFRVSSNSCRTVAAHSACVVWIRFVPVRTGEHEGVLTVHGTRGNVTVELAGYGLSGHTNWTMTSQRGDPVGQGRRYGFSQRTSSVTAVGDSTKVQVAAVADDGIAFAAEFSGVPHHPLTTGQHFRRPAYIAQDAAAPDLDVAGEGRECLTTQGTFDVRSAAYRAGQVVRFTLDFVQRCGQDTAALTGTIDYEVLPPPATAPTWAGLPR